MKTGKSLQELAAEIERQADAKADYHVPTAGTEVVVQETIPQDGSQPISDIRLSFGDKSLTIGDTAHEQIAGALAIPLAYYRRLLAEQPVLLAQNVNTWLHADPKVKLIRTLDGKARAFLSDAYRPLDNYDLAQAVLPVLGALKLRPVSAEITERRLYIKAIDEAALAEIPAGHSFGDGSHTIVKLRKLHPSVTISNSEIGHGSLRIDEGYFDQFCTNHAIWEKAGLRRNHVGKKADGVFDDEEVYKLLTDETRQADDKALWLKVRDVLKNGFNPETFARRVALIESTQANRIESVDIPAVVEITRKRFDINEGEGKSILKHLIEGADLSQFGLANAVTRAAADLASYDRATEFERIGGQLIALPANDWDVLSKAA